MRTNSRCAKLIILVSLALAVLLLYLPLGNVYRQMRQRERDSSLIVAIQRADTHKALTLLEQGANANAQEEPSTSLTTWQRLLSRLHGRPMATQSDPSQPSALVLALDWGCCDKPQISVPLITALLQHGAKVAVHAPSGDIPLLLAVHAHDLAIINLLLDHGADVNASEPQSGETALTLAAQEGSEAMVRLLLARGANVNLADANKKTPLLEALAHSEWKIARILIAQGADVLAKDGGGATTLSVAVEKGNVEMVKQLIARGVSVDAKNHYGMPPLFDALHNPAMLTLLLEHGANPNTSINDDFEDSVLVAAAHEQNLKAVQILLAHGAQVNWIGRYDFTALSQALDNKDAPMIRLLRRAGGKIYAEIHPPLRSRAPLP